MASSGSRESADSRAPPTAAAAGAAARPPGTPPAEEWQASWASTLPRLVAIRSSLSQRCDVSIMRSSQLDAARLDEELGAMLREQFLRAFALFRPGAIARLQPELTLLLEFLVFRFSIWEGQPLPGMALMNLRHRNEAALQQPQPSLSLTDSMQPAGSSGNGIGGTGSGACSGGGRSGVEGPGLSRTQRTLYCLGTVALRYAWARLGHHAASQHWGDTGSSGSSTGRLQAWVLMRQAETVFRLASLANFLAFLRSGRYRSLLERLLQARLVYREPAAARAISFEYLNRQLVWSELSELLLFLLPLVNVRAIKHTLRSWLPRLPMLGAGSGAGLGAATSSSSSMRAVGAGAEQPCGICGVADILSPWAALPCEHRFCYYCLRSHCLADPQYSCPLCLRRVHGMQRCL